jgi:hypothetical protein
MAPATNGSIAPAIAIFFKFLLLVINLNKLHDINLSIISTENNFYQKFLTILRARRSDGDKLGIARLCTERRSSEIADGRAYF